MHTAEFLYAVVGFQTLSLPGNSVVSFIFSCSKAEWTTVTVSPLVAIALIPPHDYTDRVAGAASGQREPNDGFTAITEAPVSFYI